MIASSVMALPGYPVVLTEYILLGREDRSVDLKRTYDPKQKPEEVAKDLCAIANSCALYGRGYIVVGVLDSDQRETEPDDPHIPGLLLSRDERKSFNALIQNIVRDHLDPRPSVDTDFCPFSGTRIVIIKITPRYRPYRIINTKQNNGYWIRVGSDCQKADPAAVIELFQDDLTNRVILEIIREITEYVKDDTSSLEQVVTFLVERTKHIIDNFGYPDALYIRAQLLRRLGDIPRAIGDLTQAIDLSPDIKYIVLYTEMILKPIKQRFEEIEISKQLNLDEFERREIYRLLHESELTLEDRSYIENLREDLDTLISIEQILDEMRKDIQNLQNRMERTPIDQRDARFRVLYEEVEQLESDITQRHYQIEKRIRSVPPLTGI
jgi:tetratricopeptide (TPR) repeat protein